MAKLELEVVGFNDVLNTMTINGKKQKLKTVNNVRTCSVEADKAEIVIYQTHAYLGKNWFWWSLFYYIISIFGIFDINNNKRCLVVDCRFNVNLDRDKKFVLKIQKFEDGEKFAEIEGDEVEILSNVRFFDLEAQKRHKKMKKIKFAISFLTILLVTALIVIFKI